MRARLMMKVMGIVLMLAMTVVAAHSCSGSDSNSVLNPANVEQYGLSGLCANQEAVAEAGGDDSTQTLAIPQSASQLGNVPGLSSLDPGGSYSCNTTTTTTTTSTGG